MAAQFTWTIPSWVGVAVDEVPARAEARIVDQQIYGHAAFLGETKDLLGCITLSELRH